MTESAFLELLSQHQGILHKIGRMYAREAEEREDLMQEMVLQLWRSLPSYRAELPFSTWMYRVALNTAITYVRKTTRRPALVPLALRHTETLPAPPSAALPDAEAALYRAIAQLDRLEKALVLLYLEEKSYRDIAALLDLTPTHVGVKLNRIKKKLKHLLRHETR
ncbi:RNA polymerase sigma-70 factor, ECF subfamily [Catalinimonas alkaloidigena]|uniref:RNA polymerase sigma-70 factor, ECF subfamily n=1 Tax=Catalinimonas alkaloidigena TaxID=1075417 RepID=A0A1G9GAE1_9BACT|nr:sigma-70 family RNA polymerase sigma factor [Catalinimonas alkaloidigena]SDK97531.1 RNA polymerase sigma-70 factor, ECF subfamily [Catalinimonas alkaloidigena]